MRRTKTCWNYNFDFFLFCLRFLFIFRIYFGSFCWIWFIFKWIRLLFKLMFKWIGSVLLLWNDIKVQDALFFKAFLIFCDYKVILIWRWKIKTLLFPHVAAYKNIYLFPTFFIHFKTFIIFFILLQFRSNGLISAHHLLHLKHLHWVTYSHNSRVNTLRKDIVYAKLLNWLIT